jgi:hypothetical protein
MHLGMDHRSPQQADQTEQRDKYDVMSDKLSHNLTSLILTHLPSSPSADEGKSVLPFFGDFSLRIR